MKTLTELTRDEYKARELAWRFEQLQNELSSSKGVVAQLHTQIKGVEEVPRLLAEIATLAEQLPPALGGSFTVVAPSRAERAVADLPDTKLHLLALTQGTRRFVGPRIDRLRDKLIAAEKRVVEIEQGIATLERSAREAGQAA